MKKYLCRPCAEELRAKGKKVEELAGRREKITCAQCGRRRYGNGYNVTGRARRTGVVKHE